MYQNMSEDFKGANVVLMNENSEWLVIKDPAAGSDWQCIGGQRDHQSETPVDVALREFWEETRGVLTLEQVELLHILLDTADQYWYPEYKRIIFVVNAPEWFHPLYEVIYKKTRPGVKTTEVNIVYDWKVGNETGVVEYVPAVELYSSKHIKKYLY